MGRQSVITPSRFAARLGLALFFLLSGRIADAQAPGTPLILPASIAYDSGGNLYFSEIGNHTIRRLSAAGVLTVVAGTGTQGFGGDSGPATDALLDSPAAIALDSSNNLFIADTHNHRVRRVDAVTGVISTYANVSVPVALAFNPQGELVVADAATHQVLAARAGSGPSTAIAGNGTQGFSGDEGLATAAMLDTPSGLAFDVAGDLYLADAHNHRVRRVDAATGIITTIAGSGQPGYSADQLAAGAQLDLPRGLSVDTSGTLYIADSRNQRIRRIDSATGIITTIAGNGTQGFLGDGSPATAAALDTPRAITISPAARPTLADSANNRIRQIDLVGNIQTTAGAGAVAPARTASATTLTQSSPATLSAVVSAAAGAVTGSVALVDGSNPVASASLASGTANFAVSVLSTGSHTLTAAYSGNSTLLPSTSQPLIVIIDDPTVADFTLTASSPTTVTVPAGSAATFSFAIALTGAALSSPINLSVAGAPSGATSSFNPALIPPPSGPASFTLTIDTPKSAKLTSPSNRDLACALLLAIVTLPFARKSRRRRTGLFGVMLLTGCGARINTGNAKVAPPLTYNITVSATATSPTGATLLHTLPVTLVVD